MRRKKVFLSIFLLLFFLLVSCRQKETGTTESTTKTAAGDSFVTYVDSAGIGKIALKVTLPETARYGDGAPILVYVSTFFTPGDPKFDVSFADVTTIGFIYVTYLWPGLSDPSGVKSEGTYDHGGEDSLQALRDVIRFASGQIPDINGKYIPDLSAVVPLTGNVGLYAFSHPGIAATNVLALYGTELSHVKYFVGRENPTEDLLSAMDLGYWDGTTPVINALYTYPDVYSAAGISLDYSSVLYDSSLEALYFDLNSNGKAEDGIDFIHGIQTPTMYGKYVYSTGLTQALLDNGVFTEATWPENIAMPEEAAELWEFRETVDNYPLLTSSDVKVLLVFAEKDHVQPVPDKPHVHQAYNGFTAAGLWVRLNPDSAYVSSLDSTLGAVSPDNDANSDPADWMDIGNWAHTNKAGATKLVPRAAVAEMADRVYTNNWDENLDDVLVS